MPGIRVLEAFGRRDDRGGIGRALGLNKKLATLVACGNSICGNSAIAAAAPVIDAEPRDIASAIAFTAVLGVIMVLALPLALVGLGMTGAQYGVLSGLTVYAVPQVLAAAQPGGMIAVQAGKKGTVTPDPVVFHFKQNTIVLRNGGKEAYDLLRVIRYVLQLGNNLCTRGMKALVGDVCTGDEDEALEGCRSFNSTLGLCCFFYECIGDGCEIDGTYSFRH